MYTIKHNIDQQIAFNLQALDGLQMSLSELSKEQKIKTQIFMINLTMQNIKLQKALDCLN